MLLTNAIVAAICGAGLVSLPAFGQENPISNADETSLPFVENANADGAQPSSSPNYSLLGGCPLFLLSYGYTHRTQAYGPNNGSTEVKSNADEVLAAHVFQFPVKRWSPDVPASLIPDPRIVAGSSVQAPRGYLYGGLNAPNLTHRISTRTHRRGDFFNSATFNKDSLNSALIPDAPAIVVGYSF
jgi:hypothetical protein